MMKGGVSLVMVSFLLALVHACSDNGILKQACLVSEVDLEEKWWYPQNASGEAPVYFQSNGLIKIDGRTDSLSFVLRNCNKVMVSNLTAHTGEQWIIKSITDASLAIQYPAKGMVLYARQR